MEDTKTDESDNFVLVPPDLEGESRRSPRVSVSEFDGDRVRCRKLSEEIFEAVSREGRRSRCDPSGVSAASSTEEED
jgi:hypothetical protein